MLSQENSTFKFEITKKLNNLVHHPLPISTLEDKQFHHDCEDNQQKTQPKYANNQFTQYEFEPQKKQFLGTFWTFLETFRVGRPKLDFSKNTKGVTLRVGTCNR